MYHNILTQKDHPKYRAVKKIVKLILEFVEADCIYFSESDAESKNGILTVVVSKKSPHYHDEVFDHLWKVIQNHNRFIFCLFNRECIKDEVKRGNLFFIFHCKETELVYKDAGQKPALNIKNINMKQFLKQTSKRYQIWTSEGNTIARDLRYHRRSGNHLMALYVLHQQFRYLFINASWLLTGEWLPQENISYQQEHITVFNSVLGKAFDSTNEKEREILEKLELARKAVQWGEEAESFDTETVDYVSDRLEWMKNEVRILFQQHTEKIKQIFKDYGNK